MSVLSPSAPPTGVDSYLQSEPTKPDLRAGFLVIVAMAVASGRVHSGLGSIILTGVVVLLAFALGLGRRVWPLAIGYLVLQLVYFGCTHAVGLPFLPYLGITVGLILRGFPVYLTAWVIFVKLPMGEVMATLEAARTPRSFLIVFMVVYRYVPTLLGEMQTIRVASRLRSRTPGWKRWLFHPFGQLENFMVPLLMRSGKIADELSAVAICKGLDSDEPRSALIKPRIQAADLAVLVAVAAMVVFVLLADGQLQARWF